ncbi:hypothetical protein Dimus_004031 [Dionaea muscipula]
MERIFKGNASWCLTNTICTPYHYRRSSLLPRIVKALVCLQSWMNNVVDIRNDEVTIDLDHDAANEVELVVEQVQLAWINVEVACRS